MWRKIKSWFNKTLCADFGHDYSSDYKGVVGTADGKILFICKTCGKKTWSQEDGTVSIWD